MPVGPPQPGDVIDGKYEVERILGTGGMGVVVAARHLDLGQRVAIKFMLPEALAETGTAERFLREAKTAVQLRSVHTARILDAGRLPDGEPFMVMEHLEGRDLDAELRAQGPLPPRIAVDFILQASEALAEAHGLGMVHRDVKLKNLFLTHTVDGEPLVKVLDFGLAKLVGRPDDAKLTATNALFGSPQYMSPEQMKSAKDADFRSDVWSIGVCLYELLTGRVPFEAGTVAETCAMVLKDPVPPPSLFVAGLPPHLEAVIMRALEKDPAQRYASIADLAFALQHYTDDVASVRRIIRVTRGARGGAITVQDMPPAEASSRRTLNAWDAGNAPATPPGRRTLAGRVQRFVGAVGVGVLLVASLAGMFVFLHRRSPAAAAGAETAPAPTFVPMDSEPGEAPATSAASASATLAPPTPAAPPLAPPGQLLVAEPTGASTTAAPVVTADAEGGSAHPPKRRSKATPGRAGASSTAATPAPPHGAPRRNSPGTGADYM